MQTTSIAKSLSVSVFPIGDSLYTTYKDDMSQQYPVISLSLCWDVREKLDRLKVVEKATKCRHPTQPERTLLNRPFQFSMQQFQLSLPTDDMSGKTAMAYKFPSNPSPMQILGAIHDFYASKKLKMSKTKFDNVYKTGDGMYELRLK